MGAHEWLNLVFEIKCLRKAKKILGIEITRDMLIYTLKLSEKSYVEKVLKLFNLDQAKSLMTLLGAYFKLKVVIDDIMAKQTEFTKTIPYAIVYDDWNQTKYSLSSWRCE